ncbi:Hypothetical predicted protein [Octopus vulgaris]|nr:uncharacterized protein LOC115210851 [Octopus sinensis]XP_036357761.1 uncharacterized protein LOC115210851 [Octopus sinensis]CAI9722031.1 Hypothetical predicted protein [Octopus vulgaris]
MSSYNVCQDDDISIIPNEDDVSDAAAASPNITFTLSASRQNLTSSLGITSMSALKDAYEELKKKYNELNTRYQDLLKLVDERGMKQMKGLPSDNPDEMKRRSEVDTLHKAVSKLKKELAAEKTKNQRLRSQLQSHSVETTPNTSLTSKEIGSMESLDKLMENIQFLEKIVEIHQMEVRKIRLHRNPSNVIATLSTSSHPRKQLEHNELDILNPSEHFKPCYPYSVEPSAEIVQDEDDDDDDNDPSWQDFKRDPFQTLHNPQKVIDLHQKPKTVDKLTDLNKTFLYESTTHSPQNSSVAEAAYNLPFENPTKRTEDENIICPYCSRSFHCLEMVKFQEHIAKCSSQGETRDSHRKCPVCDKNFQHVSQKDFEVHVNMHFDQMDGLDI